MRKKKFGLRDARFYVVLLIAFSVAWISITPSSDLGNYYFSATIEKALFSSSSLSSMHVRKWGCHRNETPLIFVHIGKAGGGQVRTRFAAAAQDFDRANWRISTLDNHYYPLPNGAEAKFCSSKNRQHRYKDSKWVNNTFEGVLPCNATTPLGMALACPNAYSERTHFCAGCSPRGKACHTVYVGHNHMGSEFHWLPSRYLLKWWNEKGRDLVLAGSSSNDDIDADNLLASLSQGFKALTPKTGPMWCPWGDISHRHRPLSEEEISSQYETCGAPLAATIDYVFQELFPSPDYSPLYASLPLHRVVLMRDPWGWIMSKFFWHRRNQWRFDEFGRKQRIHCDDLSQIGYPKSTRGGWADQYLLKYLAYLCGDDCEQRLERGLMTIQQAEIQAANNLRNSFSVVGLLEETDTFYDMVSTRIAYVNMSLNPDVQGAQHTSKKSEDSLVCTRIYQNPEFQVQFRHAVPLMATIERLYELAIQVNHAQQEELRECSS